jgi:hypothetical protein
MKQAASKACEILACFTVQSEVKVINSFETSVGFERTYWYYIPEERTAVRTSVPRWFELGQNSVHWRHSAKMTNMKWANHVA